MQRQQQRIMVRKKRHLCKANEFCMGCACLPVSFIPETSNRIFDKPGIPGEEGAKPEVLAPISFWYVSISQAIPHFRRSLRSKRDVGMCNMNHY
jgi:hypothetical protein